MGGLGTVGAIPVSASSTQNINCFLDGDCSDDQKCSYNDGVTPGQCISK